ncbi:hypothetical protein M0R45_032918 [Rubus argutus]|uniref:Uncharacterized protein n=1 Tax=Rubus argutus TaxID=59490 RepID=A0AAW1WLN8_RUBAR
MLPGQNAIEIYKHEGPLKEKLNPDDPNVEIRQLRHEIVTNLSGVPAPEFDEKVRVECDRETCLPFNQWRFESDREEQEEEQCVNELDKSAHFCCSISELLLICRRNGNWKIASQRENW